MSYDKRGATLKGIATYRVSEELTTSAVESILKSLDCPRSLAVWLLFKYGEHQQLVDLGTSPTDYSSVEDFRDAYSATELLSKAEFLQLAIDKEKVAIEKFRENEYLCRLTNHRFRNLSVDPQYKGFTVWLHHAVTRKIENILGEFDPQEFFSAPDWGPGASTLISRRHASPSNKFQLETGITRDLYLSFPIEVFADQYPLWADQLLVSGFPRFQVGNRVTTVPKNAKTDRVIAIEPGINLWFQLSIGKMISRRLRRYGIDIRDQSRNQRFAYESSKTDSLVTVDLSAASDTISSLVVRDLLPPRWFEVMDLCRSHFGHIKDELIRWNKFSSMGNGFTFPLETLIFYAIAKCCTEYVHGSSREVGAYGDDIVIPRNAFDVFQLAMSFYGFRINLKKSHYDSPFRESCGAHFYAGADAKPIYLKQKLVTLQSVFRLANGVRRLAHRRMSYLACDARLRKPFELLIQSVPKALRYRVPDGFGDGGFVSNFDEATPERARDGIEGYRFRHVTEAHPMRRDERVGYLLARLWAAPAPLENISEVARARLEAIAQLYGEDLVGGYNSVPQTGSKPRIRLSKSLASQWYNLGPWI